MTRKGFLTLLFLFLWVTITAVSAQAEDGPFFEVDESLKPEVAAIEPLYGDIERPLALMKSPEGDLVHFIIDEVNLRVDEDEGLLDEFLSRHNGELLHDGSLPELSDGEYVREVPPSPFRLVRVDLETVDLGQLEEDAQAIGLTGTYTFSSEEGLKLMALLLRSANDGFKAFPDMPLWIDLREHPDGSGFLDPEGACDPAFPELCDSTAQQTRANHAWEYMRTLGLDSQQMNIAIIDRGFAVDVNGITQFGLVDLPSVNVAQRFDFSRGNANISGANRVTNECNPGTGSANSVGCWHGTAVALTALARHDNRYGTAGIAINAQPLLYYSSTMGETAQAIRTAVAAGADVINNSQSTSCGGFCSFFGFFTGEDALSSATKFAMSRHVPVVASAGNGNRDAQGDNRVPCIMDGVICVGALDLNSLNRAPFSNFGGGLDMWAPGTNVQVAPLPFFNGLAWQTNTATGINGLTMATGTSFSSPYTAGVVANMKAINPNLTFTMIQSILQGQANTTTLDLFVSPIGTIDVFATLFQVNDRIPAGRISSPLYNSEWATQVELSVALTPSVTAVSVEYEALFEQADGSRVWQTVASGDPATTNFQATWDVSGLPRQRDVYVRAVLTGQLGRSSTTGEEGPFGINLDLAPPTGQIISPQTNGRVGQEMLLEAAVSDDSGVFSVDFQIHTGSGSPIVINGRDLDNDGIYSANWNTINYNNQTVSVDAIVSDYLINTATLPAVTNVLIDHNGPEVTLINPPQFALDAIWITNSNSIQVIAEAQDPDGVAEVEFTAVFRDSSGALVTTLIGSDSIPNGAGHYTAIWDVSNIPDQADRTFPYDVQVKATAVDNQQNRGQEDIGWVIGLDRQAPEITFVSPPQGIPQGSSLPIDVTATDLLGVGNRVSQLTVTARYQTAGQTTPADYVLADVNDVTGWTGSLSLVNLPDQLITLLAEAEDEAGNSMTVTHYISIDTNAPTFSSVSHSDDPFITNGIGSMSFSYTLSEWASTVLIRISDDTGNVVQELSYSNVNTDPKVAVWDGLDRYGNLVASGIYQYEFEAVDSAGNMGSHPGNSFEVISDNTPPVIALWVKPSPYSYSLGVPLDILYEQDEAGYAEIEIFDSSGSMVFFGSWHEKAGSYGRFWDGTDFLGNKLPTPATYSFNLRVTDLAGNVSTVSEQVDFTP